MSLLAIRLKTARERMGLSQKVLADATNGAVTQAQISKIEKGDSDTTTFVLKKLSHALNVSPLYLLGETDTPTPMGVPASEEASAAPQPGTQILRAAFAQRESVERCENSMSVPRLIAAIAQLRAELSELDSDAVSCADFRTISDLLFACLRALQEADSPSSDYQNKKTGVTRY